MKDQEFQFYLTEFESLREDLRQRYEIWTRLCERAVLVSVVGVILLTLEYPLAPRWLWLAIAALDVWAMAAVTHQEKIIRGIRDFMIEREEKVFLRDAEYDGWQTRVKAQTVSQPSTLMHYLLTRVIPLAVAGYSVWRFFSSP